MGDVCINRNTLTTKQFFKLQILNLSILFSHLTMSLLSFKSFKSLLFSKLFKVSKEKFLLEVHGGFA